MCKFKKDEDKCDTFFGKLDLKNKNNIEYFKYIYNENNKIIEKIKEINSKKKELINKNKEIEKMVFKDII